MRVNAPMADSSMSVEGELAASPAGAVAPSVAGSTWPFLLIGIFLHFQLVKLGSFAITFAPAFLAWFFLHHYQLALTRAGWMGLFAAIAYPFIPLWDSPIRVPFAEFMKTYTLFVLNFSLLWFALNAPIRRLTAALTRAAFLVLATVTTCAAIQSGFATLTGSPALYNLFGPFQYLYHLDPDVLMAPMIARAQAFYLEPSFAAQVVLTMGGICLLRSYRVVSVRLLLVISMVFIGSRGGWLVVLLLLLLDSLLRARALVLGMLGLGGAAALLIASPLLVDLLAAGNTVINLNYQAFDAEGSSEFLRMVLGAVIVAREVPQHLLGLPFGSVEAIVERHFGVRVPFFNNIYLITYYFGVVGVGALLALLLRAAAAFIKRDRVRSLLYLLVIPSLAISGSLLSPETMLLIILLVYQFRTALATAAVSPTDPSNQVTPPHER